MMAQKMALHDMAMRGLGWLKKQEPATIKDISLQPRYR